MSRKIREKRKLIIYTQNVFCYQFLAKFPKYLTKFQTKNCPSFNTLTVNTIFSIQ